MLLLTVYTNYDRLDIKKLLIVPMESSCQKVSKY